MYIHIYIYIYISSSPSRCSTWMDHVEWPSDRAPESERILVMVILKSQNATNDKNDNHHLNTKYINNDDNNTSISKHEIMSIAVIAPTMPREHPSPRGVLRAPRRSWPEEQRLGQRPRQYKRLYIHTYIYIYIYTRICAYMCMLYVYV